MEDLSGKRFYRLRVISFDHLNGKRAYWKCKCDCGNIKVVRSDHLKDGHVKSCGCYSSEQTSKRFTTHGLSKTRIFNIWVGIKQRCLNPKKDSFCEYGGRGISICDSWKNDFMAFYKWAIRNGYKDSLSIDRIDVDEGYFPQNCRWVGFKTQSRNKRTNHMVEFDGKLMPLVDCCDKYGVPYHITLKRILRGWSLEDALTIPNLK